jgi:outer membrane lipoprotein-sorting protein
LGKKIIHKTPIALASPSPLRLVLILLALFLHGCAGKPWTSPVAENETALITQTFTEMQQRDASCSCCLDAKATLSWDGPGEDHAIAGLLQLMLPTSLKFVVLNPLGQPLYALVSDGQEFQSINTTLRQHIIGRISSLAARYQIPEALLSENWGYWLTGRLREEGATIETIRRDVSGRGVWITMQYPGNAALAESHLLIRTETRQLLARVLVDRQGDTIATISYDGRSEHKNCSPVTRTTITDLPYKSKLTIDFSEILSNRSFTAANFRLKVPAEYNVQMDR